MAKFQKGVARLPNAGRKKNTPNVMTATVREMILEALDAAGGASYLTMIAYTKPEAFCQLVGKVLPLQVTGEGGEPIQVNVIERRIVDPKKKR